MTDPAAMPIDLAGRELPLFPLQTVLFPGGLLGLKIFEARYLDLMAACLRDRTPFGVVALTRGHELREQAAGESVGFEPVGTLAELREVDSDRPGILQVRCQGAQRFEVQASRQQADGLWLATARLLADDPPRAPAASQAGTVRALATTIATLKAAGQATFPSPYHFDDAGWVANRWCELLPITQAGKQRLMALPDPLQRLELVDEFLRGQGVVT